MKLFTKYNRINITATILTFLVGSIAFYFVLDYVLTGQLDRSLRAEQQEITKYIKEHDKLPYIPETKHQWIEVEPAVAAVYDPEPVTEETFNKLEREKEPVRKLIFTIPAEGKLYKVSVYQSKTETEDLLQLIILVTVCMIALILLSHYLINRKLMTGIWKPFYKTLDSIKAHQLSVKEPLQLGKEPIDEIDQLNDSLNKMTSRIHQDYLALKTFTENASHEMQTPLAVIRSRVESLLQDAEGKERTMQQLLSIEDAVLRLSRLHQSLLLLTKLENRQFHLNETVNLAAILKNKLAEKEDLLTAHKLSVVMNVEDVLLNFHQHLAEILISNLFSNVIRYTPEGGCVEVTLVPGYLSVKNTATGDALDHDKIFQRFYKGEQSVENTGLGLAIVKEICLVAGFAVTYQYIQGKHDFTIHFSS